MDLVAFADAAYATDSKTQCSVSGYIIAYAGAAITYKAKLQPTVATSSTKAEFIAALYTAKAIKHIHSVLSDLGLLPLKPTIIYKDNKVAIDMVNHSKLTTIFHHMDIQHFAIQEWQNLGEVEMQHIWVLSTLLAMRQKHSARSSIGVICIKQWDIMALLIRGWL